MKDKMQFLEEIKVKNDLEYRYRELIHKFETLFDNELKITEQAKTIHGTFLSGLVKILIEYPEYKDMADRVLKSIYLNEVITVNCLIELENLYNKIQHAITANK